MICSFGGAVDGSGCVVDPTPPRDQWRTICPGCGEWVRIVWCVNTARYGAHRERRAS